MKQRLLLREKERHYITTKGSTQEEAKTIVSIYASNKEVPQYLRQNLSAIKGDIDSKTIIVGDFSIPFSSMNTSSREKINTELQVLNEILDQTDLIFVGHSIQKQKNTLSSQVNTEHSSR